MELLQVAGRKIDRGGYPVVEVIPYEGLGDFAGEFWIILRRTTGEVLPHPNGRSGRGGSHVEFGHMAPRLFYTQHSAKAALRAWLQGTWWSDGDGGISDITPISARTQIAGEIDVVPIRLVQLPAGAQA